MLDERTFYSPAVVFSLSYYRRTIWECMTLCWRCDLFMSKEGSVEHIRLSFFINWKPYPQSPYSEQLFTSEWMQNGQMPLDTHDYEDEDGCCVTQSVDELVHLAQEFSKDPAAKMKIKWKSEFLWWLSGGSPSRIELKLLYISFHMFAPIIISILLSLSSPCFLKARIPEYSTNACFDSEWQ